MPVLHGGTLVGTGVELLTGRVLVSGLVGVLHCSALAGEELLGTILLNRELFCVELFGRALHSITSEG